MQSRSTEEEWLEVKKSQLWSLPEPDENDIMPVLRISYSSLTPTLKQCFAFCAIFPKDKEIMKQELIYLWMANGFISSSPNLEVEKVGNMVWNALYQDLLIWGMGDVRYIDEDESYEGVEAIPFPSLQQLDVRDLPNVERLLKRETANMFPSLSTLLIERCPKLQLPCLPRVKHLTVWRCSSETLGSISNLNGLNKLGLSGSDKDVVWCFPEGMMSNMTSLSTLNIAYFSELKELPSDFTKLTALSDLSIVGCDKLECLPEQGFEDLCSLRRLYIRDCEALRCLPEGIRHLTSLQYLSISFCPALKERCKEGTGQDWHKIAHIPQVILKASHSD
ncbi:hypothetical protein PIB30_063398 [Stylosanthes scabra]|uniref:Disease resistance protein winged helix domain-containing protein n=1 Tax=Stylosanthes scabra TaxID=79078 RepID=A0ABU6QKW2_9FABA|nr:hypothetical protein [Stylosanthes scabra]